MTGAPGFLFADVTSRTIVPSKTFVNHGVISGVDTPVGIDIYNVTQGSGGIIVPNQNQTIPSGLDVSAQNVVNSGTLAVGASGKMALSGKNMDLSYGILTAGNLEGTNEESIFASFAAEDYVLAGGKMYTQDAPNTYDLVWGVTNGWQNVGVQNFVFPQGDGLYTVEVPYPPGTTNRAGDFIGGTLIGQNLSAFAFEYAIPQGQTSNIWYNVVFVDTNFVDPNTHVSVGFGGDGTQGFAWAPILPMQGAPNGRPIMVTFSEDVVDPIYGGIVTNSVYLEDDGASLNPFVLAQNAAYVAAYSRPDTFELTTTPPGISLADFLPSNVTFDPGEIYTPGEMSTTISLTNAVYEAQIGFNPENINGSFGDLVFGAFENLTGLEVLQPDEPDFTNAPGRITINAGNLNFHDLKLEAEGLLTINATNVSGVPSVMDYGTADISLGAVTNTLLVSNLIPVLFNQLRGNLEAWGGNWVNMQTNATGTNTIHTHVLVVLNDLSAKYTPTVRNFTVKSTNVVLQDDMAVIGSATFGARQLTINNTVHLTQNASDLEDSALPGLKNFLVTSNGNFLVDSLLDVGFNIKKPVAATTPVGRLYSVLTATNEGTIVATAPTIQAKTIENDGTITAVNGGSVVLAANTLGLGLTAGLPNSISSGGQISLSANFIEATNSTIDASQLVLWPVRELTDFVPLSAGIFATNTGAMDNFWYVTNELELVRKPVNGDLYGTEIQVFAQNGAPTLVYWAAQDEGDSIGGFINNAVIGHLVLDRLTTNSVMQFFATGRKNAMYVNYLELRGQALTNYHDNLYIDPHLTIYFAAANVPPNKLTAVFPNLIYASNSVSEEISSPDFVTRRAEVAAASAGIAQPGLSVASAFAPVAGVYSGLFASPTKMSAANSGYFTYTLNKGGSFSGKILLNSSAIPISGKFDNYGSATLTTHGLSIQLLAEPSGKVVGEITGNGWDAMASGAVSPAWTAQNPAPQAGSFLLALPGAGGSAPDGASYGTLRVTAQGALTAAGKLADGSSFSQSTKVGQSGQWPFFAYAPSGKDVLLGWLNFAPDNTGVAGNVTWMKPATKGTNYPSGFNVNVQAVGTATVPATGASQ